MERLTKRIGGGVEFPPALAGVVMVPDNKTMQDVLARLAAYEDTGLTPEGVREIVTSIPAAAAKEYGTTPDRLRELVQADKEGRVVPRGHREVTGNILWRCSACGSLQVAGGRYCPGCGAKMDGGDGDAAD